MKTRPSIFLELLESYFYHHLPVSVGASENTVRSYKYAFRLLLEYLYTRHSVTADRITFQLLDYDCITGFLDWLETDRKCSPSTKNQRLSALLSFSEYAQNRDFETAFLFRNSLLRIPVKKYPKNIRAVFTVPEIKTLLQMPDERTRTGRRDKVLLSFMYASGARAQEVCDLTVKDVTCSTDGPLSVVLVGKGGKARRISIPASCSEILRQYIHYRNIENSPGSHIFSSQNHEKMSVSCIEEVFKKYVNACRLQYPGMYREKSYPPHSMRHTTASHMLEAGIPLIVIKNFLGHASISTTQVYIQISQNLSDKHLQEWSQKWFGPGNTKEDTEPKNTLPQFLNVK